MAYQALYRKWRPSTFDDVVGQSHIVSTLKNEITSGKTAHAYLFCGTRGTGKTSCAKIFARAINCLDPRGGNPCNQCEICRGVADGSILDVTEIDAASNNGVDNIREIRDEVVYSAAQARYKIYIIDEVHMLSSGAFNALLKTLEEPPPHVVFILATTEVHKLPATITSRCQRFDFRRISVKDIVLRLREITTAEGIQADSESLELIARLADGALRDALSILDQCVSAIKETLTLESVTTVLGVAADEALDGIVEAIASKKAGPALEYIHRLQADGRDLSVLFDTLTGRFRDLMVCAVSNNPDELFEYSAHTVAAIKKQAALFRAEEITYLLKLLCDAAADAKWSRNARTIYEVALIRMCDNRLSVSVDALAARIAALEDRLTGLPDAPAPAAVQPRPAVAPNAPASQAASEPAVAESDLPWETSSADMEAAKAEKSAPVLAPELNPKTEAAPTESATQPPPVPQSKPTPASRRSAAVQTANGNTWNEVLTVLKTSNVALYGALSVKKAKLTEQKLYLPNEAYLKAILTALNEPLAAAIRKVTGRDINVSFISEAELDDIEEMAPLAATVPETPVYHTAPEPDGEPAEEPPVAEPAQQDNPEIQDNQQDGADPLDALFDIEGLHVEIE